MGEKPATKRKPSNKQYNVRKRKITRDDTNQEYHKMN